MSETVVGAKLSLDRCPHCSVNRPSLRRIHSESTSDYRDRDKRYWGVYVCGNCGGVVTAFSDIPQGPVRAVFPRLLGVSAEIPERPRHYLLQAIESLHAPAGAVMLAASSVDSQLKAIGLTEGSLYARIDEASARHLITQEMAAWAHDVRLDANDQRHADSASTLPSTEDGKRCVDFALALADFLFVIPSRVRRGREAASKAPKPPVGA